jgi:Raf kinase inhibitor-like YbhB/YbcL family protein
MVRVLAFAFVFLAQSASAAEFTVTSPTLQDGAVMPLEHVQCAGGKNISPALQWKNAPAGTKSFAVTLYDPDAPTGSGWWHWQIYNIAAAETGLVANAGDPGANLAPKDSAQNINDGGKPGYMGACPPRGDKPHRYIFTVYALGLEKITVPATASNAMVGFNLNRNALAKATLTVTFGRE